MRDGESNCPAVLVLQIVFVRQAGCTEIETDHAGVRMVEGIAGGRIAPAAGDQNVEVVAKGLIWPVGAKIDCGSPPSLCPRRSGTLKSIMGKGYTHRSYWRATRLLSATDLSMHGVRSGHRIPSGVATVSAVIYVPGRVVFVVEAFAGSSVDIISWGLKFAFAAGRRQGTKVLSRQYAGLLCISRNAGINARRENAGRHRRRGLFDTRQSLALARPPLARRKRSAPTPGPPLHLRAALAGHILHSGAR